MTERANRRGTLSAVAALALASVGLPLWAGTGSTTLLAVAGALGLLSLARALPAAPAS